MRKGKDDMDKRAERFQAPPPVMIPEGATKREQLALRFPVVPPPAGTAGTEPAPKPGRKPPPRPPRA